MMGCLGVRELHCRDLLPCLRSSKEFFAPGSGLFMPCHIGKRGFRVAAQGVSDKVHYRHARVREASKKRKQYDCLIVGERPAEMLADFDVIARDGFRHLSCDCSSAVAERIVAEHKWFQNAAFWKD
jgi:hypothetical protein